MLTFVTETDHQSMIAPVEPDDVRLIKAIASWCECLQGKHTLVAALRQLSRAVGARSICLSRHSREPIRMAQTLAISEPEIVASSVDVDRSYAHCVLGVYIDRPRAGSLWLSSMMDEHNDPALRTFQVRAQIKETAIIALAVEEKRIDYLELHLAKRMDDQAHALLNMLADALSRIWATRSPGLFSDAILSSREVQCVSPRRGYLLSTANPSGLSRAEFRICLLLSRGLNRTSVCNELSISQSTLRTHLRNIFKKTGKATLAELLFVLLAPSHGAGEALPRRLARLV